MLPKQTKLSEDAEIYKKREVRSEHEKLKDMHGKKKFEYLWIYYRTPVFITIVTVVLLFSMVYSMMKPKTSYVLRAAIINNPYSEELLTQLDDDFTPVLNLEKENEDVFLDTMFAFNAEASFASELRAAFVTYVYANELDVIIGPKSEFDLYLESELFYNLADILPTDLCTALSNHFLFAEDEESSMDVYGISLKGTVLDSSSYEKTEEFFIGIPATTQHKENAIKLIRYLYNLEP